MVSVKHNVDVSSTGFNDSIGYSVMMQAVTGVMNSWIMRTVVITIRAKLKDDVEHA